MAEPDDQKADDTGGIAAPSELLEAEAVRELGRNFAGIGVSDDGSLVVKVLKPAQRQRGDRSAVAAALTDLKSRHPGARFVEDATFSADELQAAWLRLSNLVKDLQSQGVRISSRYIDWLENRVIINVDATGEKPAIDLGPETVVVSGPYPGGTITGRQPDKSLHYRLYLV